MHRGGGDLLIQLHALGETESKLYVHQKRLSEIEAKVDLSFKVTLLLDLIYVLIVVTKMTTIQTSQTKLSIKKSFIDYNII